MGKTYGTFIRPIRESPDIHCNEALRISNSPLNAIAYKICTCIVLTHDVGVAIVDTIVCLLQSCRRNDSGDDNYAVHIRCHEIPIFTLWAALTSVECRTRQPRESQQPPAKPYV